MKKMLFTLGSPKFGLILSPRTFKIAKSSNTGCYHFNYSLSSQKTDLLAFVCHSDRDSNSHQHNQRQACCPPELLILANTDLCLFIFILCNNFCKKSTRLQRVTNSCSRSRRQTHWPQTTAWHWTQFKCKVQL